jgi:tetratricopeptide (TPR) repeat protein
MLIATDKATHHGQLVKDYRKRKKWSRDRLAMELHVDTSTVYRMEQQEVIRNLTRRRLLVGLLGIPAGLLGIEEAINFFQQPTQINNDRMAFFEEHLNMRWDMYHTGGTIRANRGLQTWISEITAFAHETTGTIWEERSRDVVVMSYQLQGSIYRDLMLYEDAHQSYEAAFSFAREMDDPELMASALARRGVTYIQQNQPKDAIQYLDSAYKIINGLGLPSLKGYILQGLSEAYAQDRQSYKSWHHLEAAEHALQRQSNVQERTHCNANTTSITSQRGINAVWLADYGRAVTLIDKGLLKYDPTLVRGRARLIAQKAEALYGLKNITECVVTAEEALVLANSVGSTKTVARVKNLYQTLAQSTWKAEPTVARLGALLWN